MNHSKLSRLLSAVTSLTVLSGMLPSYQASSIFTAYAEENGEVVSDLAETEESYEVTSSAVRFDLNGGSLTDEHFTVSDGVAVLKDENDPANAPIPEAPALSNLVFTGWTDASGNAITEYEADATYYASWSYGTNTVTNPESGLVYYLNHGGFYDFRGNSGGLRTTFYDGGYDILYKVGDNSGGIGKSGLRATYNIASGLVVTPVFTFCDANGNVSENAEENVYAKVTYVIQNRSDTDVESFSLASTADVQIGGNDHAAIYGFADDDTQLTSANCADYHVKNIEMRDGGGNIFMLSIPEDANSCWGYYGSRHGYAYSSHTSASYSTGYDSGIAYSWSGLSVPAGATIEKSVIFAVGDIHLFKTHSYNANGICYGGDSCPLVSDHTAAEPMFFQKPQSFSENGNTRYEVRNAGQLMWLAKNINSGDVDNNVRIELINDIDFSMNLEQQEDGSYAVSGVLPWTPIRQFSGTFNGKGHTISGLYYTENEAGGLFGSLSGATVQNVGIKDSWFESASPVGSIAASADNDSSIVNVYSTAYVAGENAGGLIYDLVSSSLSKSYFAGTGAEVICGPDADAAQLSNVYLLSDSDAAFAASAAKFASGEVAYNLGSSWSQDLGAAEALPHLGSDKNVYSYTENRSCSPSAPKPITRYTNDSTKSGTTVRVEHVLDWGRVVKQATCTTNELWNKKCKNCEYETSELFDRGDDGVKATGHNHNSSGYCQNIDPNTGSKCNHYDAAYTTTTTSTTTTTGTTTTTVYSRRNNEKYHVFNNGMTWQEAKEYCESIGGHLAVITSQSEQDQINNLLSAFPAARRSYWIGGHINSNGNFQWVTDEAFSYTNWNNGEPNSGFAEPGLMLYGTSEIAVLGKWNDLKYDCSGNPATFYNKDNFGFICEWDDPEAAATTTTTTASTTTTTSTTKRSTVPLSTYTRVLTTVSTATVTTTEPVPQAPRRLDIDGEMTVSEMNIDQIRAAGIDLEDESNYHVFDYEVKMTFDAEIVHIHKYVPVTTKPAVTQTTVAHSHTPGSTTTTTTTPAHYSVEINGIELPVIGHYETVSQEMYMFIRGECKWLKEFYDVELLVINKDNEPLTDCSAELDVPEGLTLANSEQLQSLGDLGAGQAFDVHWYVRGDVAGDYDLSAMFKGKNRGEEFEYPFHSRNTLHVYAGNALKMTIELPCYSFFDEDYPVKITFKNVSDKPIYNIEHKIKSTAQTVKTTRRKYDGKRLISESVTYETLQNNSINKKYSLGVMEPGDEIVAEVTIHDIWKSILEEELEDQKLAADWIVLLTCCSKHPVLLGINYIASIYQTVLDNIVVAHVLKSVEVATLPGSTTTVPHEVIITGISDELTDKYSKDMLQALARQQVGWFLDKADAPETIQFIYNTGGYIEDQTDPHNSLDDKIYNGVQYGLTADPTGISPNVVTLGHDYYYRYHKPAGGGDVRFYVVKAERASSPAPKAGIRRAPQAMRSAAEDFDIEILEGDYTIDENGDYIISSDAIIKVVPKTENIYAVIGLDTGDAETSVELPVVTVPDHECSGEYFILAPPSNGKGAVRAKFCDVCHSLIDCSYINRNATVMLSNGECYQDIRSIARMAAETDEPIKAYLIGNVNIVEDVTLPENVTIIITADTKININDGCKFTTEGETIDFSGNDNDQKINVVLNYWEGRSELMQIESGTEVTSLPDIGTETCPLLGWYTDAEHTQAFEPFTAGAYAGDRVYYADIHHEFNAYGRCTKCGELKNGRDAFTGLNISVSGEIKLNLKTKLSPAAYADKDAEMVFEFENGTVQTQKMSQARANGDGIYTFTCIVDPVNMADTVKAHISYSDGVSGGVLNYSLKTYFSNILARQSSLDPKSVAMVKALMNYGGYLQKYRGVSENKLVNKDLGMPLDNETVTLGDEYTAVVDNAGTTVRAKSANISISSYVNINVKFTLADGKKASDYKFTVDGKVVNPAKDGDVYVVSLRGIAPTDFGKMYTVRAESKTDAADHAEVKYSVYTYIRGMLKTSTDNDLNNVMKAIVKYGEAVTAYNEK